MLLDSLCPCKSKRLFQQCCYPFLEGTQHPETPEKLMRSRYTAYATGNIDYIESTMKEEALHGFSKEEALSWTKEIQFTDLEILSTGNSSVEFKAYYQHNGEQQVIHEDSLFRRVDGRWFYVGQKTKKIKRNDACLCGSGKKYKRCCGA
jgi:SEC-C motif-containing protein